MAGYGKQYEGFPEHLRPKDANAKGELFSNDFFEKTTRTPIWVPYAVYYPLIAYLIWYSINNLRLNVINLGLVFLGGVFFWTFMEYIFHRYLFHIQPTNKFKKNLQLKMHGIHHHYPGDKDRLVMPPIISIFLAAFFLGTFYLAVGNWAFALLAGFIFGYLKYLFVHYITHVFKQPKNFLAILWTHHYAHHFQDPNVAFGVSSPLWDLIFFTMPRKRKKIKKN